MRGVLPELKLNEFGYYEVHSRANGKLTKQSLRTKDADEAREAFSLVLLRQAPTPAYTVAQAWQLRESDGLAHVAAPQRIKDAWKALLPYFGGRVASSITTRDCVAYTAHRQAAGRSIQTARRELAELKATCRFFVQLKRLPSTDLPIIELPQRGEARPRFLSFEERDVVLAAAAKQRKEPGVPTRLELFLRIGLATGQRKAAIEQLQWDQVCFDTNVIHFARAGDPVTRKRKGRVPFLQDLRQVLLDERERAATPYVLRNGGAIRTSFDNLMHGLGLSDVTPHVLRHTLISHLLMRETDVFTVSKLVSVSVAEIERTYGHLTNAHFRAALSTLS